MADARLWMCTCDDNMIRYRVWMIAKCQYKNAPLFCQTRCWKGRWHSFCLPKGHLLWCEMPCLRLWNAVFQGAICGTWHHKPCCFSHKSGVLSYGIWRIYVFYLHDLLHRYAVKCITYWYRIFYCCTWIFAVFAFWDFYFKHSALFKGYGKSKWKPKVENRDTVICLVITAACTRKTELYVPYTIWHRLSVKCTEYVALIWYVRQLGVYLHTN